MQQALGDVRVIEVGEMVSAPYAAKLLADMGAEVVKVERPPKGDAARRLSPLGEAETERSGLFLSLNANKRGVTLDLAKPQGMALLERLAAQADVLVHNIFPPEMDALGFSVERLQRANPALIVASISPFGADGPYRDYRAEDLTLWSAGGACYISGIGDADVEMPPLKSFGHPAGYAGGMQAAVATLAALMGQQPGMPGAHVEVSVREAIIPMDHAILEWPFAGTILSRLGGKLFQPMEAMQAKDGWVFVQASEEAQWKEFLAMMGNPAWADDPGFANKLLRAQNWDRLQPLLQEWVGRQSAVELSKQAQARRIPFVPVFSLGELIESEHLAAHEFFAELEHPVAGPLRYPGAFATYSRTPWQMRRAAPLLGEHNAEVYGALGLPASELCALKSMGVI